jgi:hypothetical protein
VDFPAPVAPGGQATLNFTATAPATPGTYNFQWSMIYECVGPFDDPCPNVAVQVVLPPAPVANFTFTCTGLSCSFNGTGSTGTGLTPTWSFGDAGTGSGSTPGHLYPAAGAYLATLTVTDSWGRQSTRSKTVSAINEAAVPAESFFTVPSCRIADTRTSAPLTSGVQRAFPIAGLCGIPASAKAVSFNVTIVSSTGAGHLAFGNPSFGPFPHAAINFDPANSPRANNAILRLGGGSVNVNPFVNASPGEAHVLLDVYGYFSEDTTPAPGAQGPYGFQTVSPCRIANTRTGAPVAAGTNRSFTVQGVCGVPVGAAAAALNLAVLTPSASGHASLLAAPSTRALLKRAGRRSPWERPGISRSGATAACRRAPRRWRSTSRRSDRRDRDFSSSIPREGLRREPPISISTQARGC